jgi:hypothetical protein
MSRRRAVNRHRQWVPELIRAALAGSPSGDSRTVRQVATEAQQFLTAQELRNLLARTAWFAGVLAARLPAEEVEALLVDLDKVEVTR